VHGAWCMLLLAAWCMVLLAACCMGMSAKQANIQNKQHDNKCEFVKCPNTFACKVHTARRECCRKAWMSHVCQVSHASHSYCQTQEDGSGPLVGHTEASLHTCFLVGEYFSIRETVFKGSSPKTNIGGGGPMLFLMFWWRFWNMWFRGG
jgi:hypothetical protein